MRRAVKMMCDGPVRYKCGDRGPDGPYFLCFPLSVVYTMMPFYGCHALVKIKAKKNEHLPVEFLFCLGVAWIMMHGDGQ